VGPDETQVFPPWNTENYNGLDIDSVSEFESDPEAKNKITYPHIYGWKTPQKHMIKMVDGNYKCNFRWQRLEIKSAQGNHLIFKDDRVHPSHARKMVAKLEAMGQKPLYYENIEGGHGGAADIKQAAYVDALTYTFLASRLGLTTPANPAAAGKK
jgi:hypothetical protein